MNTAALDLIHGDRVFIPGLTAYIIPSYMEKDFGNGADEPIIEEGHNVLTLSLKLARTMGCNPIICVGIDLSYSEGKSYSSGIANHPLYPAKKNLRTKVYEDKLVVRRDIYGNEVNTLWKWISEAIWYGETAKKSPELLLINATEGGIGFPHVLHMKLQEVKELYLKKTYDLTSWLQGAIQASPRATN